MAINTGTIFDPDGGGVTGGGGSVGGGVTGGGVTGGGVTGGASGGGVVGGVSGSSTTGGVLFAGSSSVDKFTDVKESVRHPDSINEAKRAKLSRKPKTKGLFLLGFN